MVGITIGGIGTTGTRGRYDPLLKPPRVPRVPVLKLLKRLVPVPLVKELNETGLPLTVEVDMKAVPPDGVRVLKPPRVPMLLKDVLTPLKEDPPAEDWVRCTVAADVMDITAATSSAALDDDVMLQVCGRHRATSDQAAFVGHYCWIVRTIFVPL